MPCLPYLLSDGQAQAYLSHLPTCPPGRPPTCLPACLQAADVTVFPDGTHVGFEDQVVLGDAEVTSDILPWLNPLLLWLITALSSLGVPFLPYLLGKVYSQRAAREGLLGAEEGEEGEEGSARRLGVFDKLVINPQDIALLEQQAARKVVKEKLQVGCPKACCSRWCWLGSSTCCCCCGRLAALCRSWTPLEFHHFQLLPALPPVAGVGRNSSCTFAPAPGHSSRACTAQLQGPQGPTPPPHSLPPGTVSVICCLQELAPRPDGIGPPEPVNIASAEASAAQYVGLLVVTVAAGVFFFRKAFEDGDVHWLPLLGGLVAAYFTYEGVYYLRLQNYVDTVQRPQSRVSEWEWSPRPTQQAWPVAKAGGEQVSAGCVLLSGIGRVDKLRPLTVAASPKAQGGSIPAVWGVRGLA